MNIPVSDASVREYAARVRAGKPTKDLFPTRMSDCAFTASQREVIRQARVDRRAAINRGKVLLQPAPTAPTASNPAPPKTPPTHALSKLGRLLYLQSNRCFFCGEPLPETDASIEHLNPLSRGGTKTEDNEVVCHKTLNHVFGNMDLKHKFAFVLNSAGSFKCPKK